MTHQSLLTQIFIHVGIIQQTNYTCNFYRLYNVCGPTVRKIKEVGLARKLVTIYNSHIFNYSFDAKEFSFNISQSYSYPHDSRIITPPSSCLQGLSFSQSAYHTHRNNQNGAYIRIPKYARQFAPSVNYYVLPELFMRHLLSLHTIYYYLHSIGPQIYNS